MKHFVTDLREENSAAPLTMYLTELGSVDFSKYTPVSKRCCAFSQCTWPQKAVVHSLQVYPVGDITNEETAKRFYLEARFDEYKNIMLCLFEDYGLICASIDYIPHYYTVQKLTDLIRKFEYKTYAGRRRRIERMLAETSGYVNLVDIRIAELMGEPTEYVETLKRFRQEKVDQKQKEHEAERRKRELEKAEKFEAQKKELQDAVDTAEKIIREGGTLKNTDVYVPRTADEGLDTSLILYLLRLHQINVPLRTQGWINHALVSADFAGEGCTSLMQRQGSKTSKVIFQYLKQLATAVQLNRYKEDCA